MTEKEEPKKVSGRNTQTGEGNIIEHDERMVPQFHKGNEIYGEHLARYEVAKTIIQDKTVLDVASGSGYGTRLMADSAKKVYGVDISAEAIAYSEEHYAKDNIDYLLGDGSDIPLSDKKVDIVTSFETIEHIKDYRRFLREVKRVLKPEGVFIVSTPNELEFTEGNHFHLHEFEEKELLALLQKQYKYVVPYYQATWLYNLIGNQESFSKEWAQNVQTLQTTRITNQKVLYFYFLCSDKPISKKLNTLGTIGEHWSERKVREKDHLTQNHIHNIEAIVEDQRKYVKKQALHIGQLEEKISRLESALTHRVSQRLKRIAKRS